MRWVDLSQPFFDDMPQSRVMKEPMSLSSSEVPSPHEDNGRVRLTAFKTYSHIGTHVDAPLHFFRDAASIDELPLDMFAGPAVVLDVPKDDMSEITVEDLGRAGPEPQEGEIVLVKTGWGERFTAERVKEYVNYPFLSPAVADWFVRLRIKMLGMDTPSPDMPHRLRPAGYKMDLHTKLFKSRILIMENLNLAMLQAGRCTVYAFPLALKGSDGAPARVVARVE